MARLQHHWHPQMLTASQHLINVCLWESVFLLDSSRQQTNLTFIFLSALWIWCWFFFIEIQGFISKALNSDAHQCYIQELITVPVHFQYCTSLRSADSYISYNCSSFQDKSPHAFVSRQYRTLPISMRMCTTSIPLKENNINSFVAFPFKISFILKCTFQGLWLFL